MKAFAFQIFFLFSLVACSEQPEVTLQYAATYDDVCSTKYSYKIDSKWKQELVSRLPGWRRLWNKDGSLLLKTSTQIAGKPFQEQNFKVALSVCSFPSISVPLIVNCRYVLKSFTQKPISDSVFISIVEHEILHNYLDSFLPKTTTLLMEYKSESKTVLNHLHLFALQKATYLELGWKKQLKEIILKDESINKDYKRAWEIVNQKENYLSFVKELSSTPNVFIAPPLEV